MEYVQYLPELFNDDLSDGHGLRWDLYDNRGRQHAFVYYGYLASFLVTWPELRRLE